jgi:hypothetical protein
MRLFHGFVLSRFANSRGHFKNKSTSSIARNIRVVRQLEPYSMMLKEVKGRRKQLTSHCFCKWKKSTKNAVHCLEWGLLNIRGFSLFAWEWGLEINPLEKRGLNVSGSGLCMMVSFGGSNIGREAVNSLLVLLILLVLLSWLQCRFYAIKASEIVLFH